MDQQMFNNGMQMNDNQMNVPQLQFNGYSTGTPVGDNRPTYYQHDKQPDIRELVNKIDNKIDSKQENDIFDDYQDIPMIKETQKESEKENQWSHIFNVLTLKDMVLLIVIYIIMSLSFVQNFIAGYIPYIKPEENGVIPTTGIIIYAIFFAVIYLISRKLILKY
jgi:uncharacterized protein YqhQ